MRDAVGGRQQTTGADRAGSAGASRPVVRDAEGNPVEGDGRGRSGRRGSRGGPPGDESGATRSESGGSAAAETRRFRGKRAEGTEGAKGAEGAAGTEGVKETDGAESAEAARGAEEDEEVEWVEWVVRVVGAGRSGTPPDLGVPLIHLTFSMSSESKPSRELLCPGRGIESLHDEELRALLARSREIS